MFRGGEGRGGWLQTSGHVSRQSEVVCGPEPCSLFYQDKICQEKHTEPIKRNSFPPTPNSFLSSPSLFYYKRENAYLFFDPELNPLFLEV